MAGPLSHIRVLDLSRIMAGPWSSQILANLGADVIKVERPGAGDDTRAWGPPYLRDAAGVPTTEAGYYLCVNRGKRSVTIDLNTTRGQELVRALALRSDILLENFKVGTLARFGLGYEDLKKSHPGLIYASITGFGQTGPKAKVAAYDFMIQAMGGLMSVTGERDSEPGGGPQKVGVPIVDLMTGMYATIAMLAALSRRSLTGRGEYIDVAMLDVQVAFLANQAMNYLVTNRVPGHNGNRHPNIQPQNVFACRGGHLALAVGNDEQFGRFCKVLGLAELAVNPQFAKNADRVRNLRALYEIIQPRLLERDAAEWVHELESTGVPCAPINTIDQVFAEPQVEHRGMLQRLAHPLAGEVPQVVSPMKFTESPLTFDRPPPLLGEHTRQILGELGLDDAAISQLQSQKIV
jgi:crotonobetainyl-CoA:carnitine CoA-transferase CaiB-like acyl-CoA transferase